MKLKFLTNRDKKTEPKISALKIPPRNKTTTLNRFFSVFLSAFLAIFLLIFSSAFGQIQPAKKVTFAASINPIYQILLAIIKDQNASFLIIKPNFSEHDYQLKKSDVQNLAQADLVFYVDENLERNLAKLLQQKNSYQLSKINGIKLLSQRDNSKKTDLHLWLNPQNAIKIAEFMTQKICQIDADNCPNYQKNFIYFAKNVNQAAKKIAQDLKKIKGENYVFYHDGYQYFEDYFDLKPLAIISNNHNHELSIASARQFNQLVKNTKIKCLFGDFYDEKNSAQNLAKQNNIKFAKLNLLGQNDGQNDDYPNLILKIFEEMSFCLGSGRV